VTILGDPGVGKSRWSARLGLAQHPVAGRCGAQGGPVVRPGHDLLADG
jgi:hypothetical protein